MSPQWHEIPPFSSSSLYYFRRNKNEREWEGTAVFMELFTNVDLFLSHMHETYGLWLYVVLGLIFFLESGVFLPVLSFQEILSAIRRRCNSAAAGVLDPRAVIFLGSTVGALLEILSDFLELGLVKDFSPTNPANGLIKKIFKGQLFLTSTAAMQ